MSGGVEMKLNIVGNVFSQTGYAVHTRFLSESLQDAGYDVAIESPKQSGWETLCPDKMFKMLSKNYQREVSIMISTPEYYEVKWADNPKKLIGFCVSEGDVIPKYWLKHFEVCNQVWFPSKHCLGAALKTWPDNKPKDANWYIIPHGVDTTLFYPKVVKRDDKFTFLAVKGWAEGLHDRGGTQYLIKAFVEEFKEDEAVKLVVKVNRAYGSSKQLIEIWCKQLGIDKLPSNVELILNDIPYHNLVDLYNQADVFVCATRGEGFNLPGLEAMACGLPTLQTGFGGQLDYMTTTNSWSINYKLEEPTHNIMFEGIKWATPDHDDLKAKLRYCAGNQDMVKKKGIQALIDSKNWTWKNSAEKAKLALDKL